MENAACFGEKIGAGDGLMLWFFQTGFLKRFVILNKSYTNTSHCAVGLIKQMCKEPEFINMQIIFFST